MTRIILSLTEKACLLTCHDSNSSIHYVPDVDGKIVGGEGSEAGKEVAEVVALDPLVGLRVPPDAGSDGDRVGGGIP